MRSQSHTDALIRGGQTTQHWFRMAYQVLKTSLVLGLLLFVLTYAVRQCRKLLMPVAL